MKYSPSTGGFYSPDIHGNTIPSDSLDISNERYQELLNGQSQGMKIISGDDGFPILVEYDLPVLTYQSELSSLNAEYQVDVDKFNRSFAIAYLSDGPSQESKQATIRAQYEVRKTQHAENVAALKARYGV